MKVAVLGAGNAGMALAAEFARHGAETTLANRTVDRLRPVIDAGGVTVTVGGRDRRLLPVQTAIPHDAVARSDVIVIATNTDAHEEVAHLAGRYAAHGVLVVLVPGHTGGALVVRRVLEECHRSDLCIVEAQALPFVVRVGVSAMVDIHQRKTDVPIATVPRQNVTDVVDALVPFLEGLRPVDSVLWTGLHNMTIVMQPALLLLNFGRVGLGATPFRIYAEANEAIGVLMHALDKERIAVAGALGVHAITAAEWLASVYGTRGETLDAMLRDVPGYRGIEAPQTVHHRFLTEHVKTGLVPLSALGHLVGIATPTTEAVIQLSSVLLGRDLRSEGRTAERMGLTPPTLKRLCELVE